MATVTIKDDKLEEFYQQAREKDWLEDPQEDGLPSNYQVPQWQIDETLRRRALPDRPEPRPWSEIKEKYRGRDI